MLTEKINRATEHNAHGKGGPQGLPEEGDISPGLMMKRNQSWRENTVGRGAASAKSWSSNRLLSLKNKSKADVSKRSEKVKARTSTEVD